MTHVSFSPACGIAGGCYRCDCRSKQRNVPLFRRSGFATPARLPSVVVNATGSAAQPASDGADGQGIEDVKPVSVTECNARQSVSQEQSQSIMQRIKKFFGGDKMDMQRLKALGLGAVASYGCVSNVTYGTGLSISWITFVRQTGKSPLMANQWKPFLALYGGFWAAQHFIRPLRFSLALAMSPVFDRFINWVQQQTQWKRQNAFAVYLFLLGSVTCITVFGSIRLFAGPLAFAKV